jgi:hypothetical protein
MVARGRADRNQARRDRGRSPGSREEAGEALERQLALADVERAARGTERQKAIESLPVAQLPGEAAGAVAHLVAPEDLLVLRSRSSMIARTKSAYDK